ncbi:type I-F CRISPR-associated protein Csy2 [Shewanella sp. AC34-MNA-CIBAN-0136]|uniref:type I-F CRISPR-associated protein Csy2 n=1 Tax=Shewanella sp. AC34-MNA-CIBAN-0136 TaxID=3140463 RepID=UPI00332EBC67
MVIKHLSELLQIKELGERTEAIRRGFSSFTDSVDVTGCEKEALIILVNLTFPKKAVKDVLDKKHAKATLKDEYHLNECIKQVEWFHTHNLKYPDIRVSKQRLITTPIVPQRQVLSSADCSPTLGWSNNSAKINLAKLFVCHFYWQGRLVCLANIFCGAISKEWLLAFKALGISAKSLNVISAQVQLRLPQSELPSYVDKYSTQVLMPYHDSYTSITPVVSHGLQVELQQAASRREGRYTHLNYTRPGAVSELVAGLGGKVRCLNYPPKISDNKSNFHESMLTRLEHGESLFDQYALLRNEFSKALDKLVDNYAELAIKQRRQARLNSLKQVRQSLIAWVAPLIEGRKAVEENDVDIKVGLLNQGGIEGQLLNSPYSEWESLLSLLFSHLNLLLSNSNKTRKYAYHPDLMKPLKSQLLWILKQLSRCPTEVTDAQPLKRYLHLKNINVYDAQLLSNPYCFGLPSLTAVWGMMHNYQRKLNEMLGTTIRFTSFAWFISQYDYTKGTQLPEFTMQGRKESEFRRPGIIDKRNGDLVFDLVIHIDGYEDDLAKLDNNTAKLKACFPSRFAGGTMHGPSVNADYEWCKLYENEDLLYSILSRSPAHGKWVMPTKHSIHSVRELTLLLENNMSLCPVMAGYILLEKPKSRVGSIAPLHSYGEPVIGLVSCDSAIDIRLQGQLNFYRRAFWFLEAKEQFLLMKRI